MRRQAADDYESLTRQIAGKEARQAGNETVLKEQLRIFDERQAMMQTQAAVTAEQREAYLAQIRQLAETDAALAREIGELRGAVQAVPEEVEVVAPDMAGDEAGELAVTEVPPRFAGPQDDDIRLLESSALLDRLWYAETYGVDPRQQGHSAGPQSAAAPSAPRHPRGPPALRDERAGGRADPPIISGATALPGRRRPSGRGRSAPPGR